MEECKDKLFIDMETNFINSQLKCKNAYIFGIYNLTNIYKLKKEKKLV